MLPPPGSGQPVIAVEGLRKDYLVPEREAGAWSALRGLVKRTNRVVSAVEGVSFTIGPGEVVGFLGPNGAGKTTTLKMLTGLLHPTDGEATVLGSVPWRRERSFLRQITLVMGQRNQLAWDIPVADSFEMQRVIYRVSRERSREVLAEMVDLLDLGDLLKKPPRNLSLGERMKCEIAGSLLHEPRVLFLDEPTLGLDVTMQRRIRDFIAAYNARHGATVLLTSHYMADVEALCQRVIVIHRGRLLYDGDLAGLVARFSPDKTIVVTLKAGADPAAVAAIATVTSQDGVRITLRVPKAETARVTGQLLASVAIADLTVEDPPVEDVIERVFHQGSLDGAEPGVDAGADRERGDVPDPEREVRPESASGAAGIDRTEAAGEGRRAPSGSGSTHLPGQTRDTSTAAGRPASTASNANGRGDGAASVDGALPGPDAARGPSDRSGPDGTEGPPAGRAVDDALAPASAGLAKVGSIGGESPGDGTAPPDPAGDGRGATEGRG